MSELNLSRQSWPLASNHASIDLYSQTKERSNGAQVQGTHFSIEAALVALVLPLVKCTVRVHMGQNRGIEDPHLQTLSGL